MSIQTLSNILQKYINRPVDILKQRTYDYV